MEHGRRRAAASGAAPAATTAIGRGAVLDRHLGAQLVEAEPLGEVGRAPRRRRGRARRPLAVGLRDDEVEQDLALRRQQRAVAGPCPRRQPPTSQVRRPWRKASASSPATRTMARSGQQGDAMATPVIEGAGHCVAPAADISRRCPGLNPGAPIRSPIRPHGAPPMAQPFDLLLTGGTVVNQDGARRGATSASGTGAIAAIGDLSRAAAGETHGLPGPAHPARRHRHAGAFPRARPRAQGGPGNGLARRRHGRGHGGVRDAEHQAADHERRGAGRQGGPRAAIACTATSPSASAARTRTRATSRAWSGCRALPASRCSWAPPRARCWSRTSRRRRDPAPHPPPRRLPRRGRGDAAGARGPAACAGDPASHPVWRRPEAALRRPSGWCASPSGPARASTCCTSRPPRRCASWPSTRTWASVEVTPHHLTLDGAEAYRAPRHPASR